MAGRFPYLLRPVVLAMLLPLVAGAAAAHVGKAAAHVNSDHGYADRVGVNHGGVDHAGVDHGGVRQGIAPHSTAHVPCHPSADAAAGDTAPRAQHRAAHQPTAHHGHHHAHHAGLHGAAQKRSGEQIMSAPASTPFHACPGCTKDCKCSGGCVSVSASLGLYADGGVLEFASFGEIFMPSPAVALRSWLTRPSPPPPRI